MNLKQNLKDSIGQNISKNDQLMKISLFSKTSNLKFVFAFVFVVFVFVLTKPSFTSADFVDSVKSILGVSVQAEENTEGSEDYNSQNIPLLEATTLDMKNIKNDDPVIVGTDSISTEGSSFGMGIESISDGSIVVYTVKEGDTLSQIAEDFNISQNTIRWENNITGQNIKVGQKLNILPVTGVKHIVKKGDTIGSIASKYDGDGGEISVYNGLTDNNSLKVGDVIFVPNGVKITTTTKSPSNTTSSSKGTSSVSSGYYIRPASGPITSPYGPRWGSYHYGIDIGNKRGTTVVAAASGKVVKVVSGCKEGATSCGGRYGNYIVIEHPNGQYTRYAHLQKVSISMGQTVSQGKKIGTIGNTGSSTGPHLHFQIEKANGSTIKPKF